MGRLKRCRRAARHQMLGVHDVRDDLGAPLSWNIGFLISGCFSSLADGHCTSMGWARWNGTGLPPTERVTCREASRSIRESSRLRVRPFDGVRTWSWRRLPTTSQRTFITLCARRDATALLGRARSCAQGCVADTLHGCAQTSQGLRARANCCANGRSVTSAHATYPSPTPRTPTPVWQPGQRVGEDRHAPIRFAVLRLGREVRHLGRWFSHSHHRVCLAQRTDLPRPVISTSGSP